MTDLSTHDEVRFAEGLVMSQNPATQVLMIVNEGETTWTDMFAKQRYTLEPGQRTFVPFFAACLWFGHPDAADIPGDRRKQYRLEEFQRLQVRIGTYDDHEAFFERRPKIGVYTVDGARVITVKDDPAGDHLNPMVQDQNERELLVSAMAAMQQQMETMKAQMEALQRGDDAAVQAGDVRTDVKGSAPEPVPHPQQGVVTDGPPPSPVQPGTPTAPPTVPVPQAPTPAPQPQTPPVIEGDGGMPASLADHPPVPRKGPVTDGRTVPDDAPEPDDPIELAARQELERQAQLAAEAEADPSDMPQVDGPGGTPKVIS